MREGRLIRNMYVDRFVKLRLDQWEARSVKTGRGVRQGCCWCPILFFSEHLTKQAPEGFGDFRTVGRVIRTVTSADDLELLAKKEAVLQGMSERIEMWRCCGMQTNVEKTNTMRFLMQLAIIQIMTDHKQLENVEYLKYLGSIRLVQDEHVTLNPVWIQQ